jgi:RNA polymerase sigma factor (TIGR02999 family)
MRRGDFRPPAIWILWLINLAHLRHQFRDMLQPLSLPVSWLRITRPAHQRFFDGNRAMSNPPTICLPALLRHARIAGETLDFFLAAERNAMPRAPASHVTTVLQELHSNDQDAQSRLLSLVYDELRRMAAGFLGNERPNHSYRPTDLAHEAVIRLLGADLAGKSRTQFFAVAAKAMRDILVEHARRRVTAKRGGGCQRVPLDDIADYFEQESIDVMALHEALERLAALDQRKSQVVTLRFFGGYTNEEVGQLLDVSKSTIDSDWRIARAWLYGQLAGSNP